MEFRSKRKTIFERCAHWFLIGHPSHLLFWYICWHFDSLHHSILNAVQETIIKMVWKRKQTYLFTVGPTDGYLNLCGMVYNTSRLHRHHLDRILVWASAVKVCCGGPTKEKVRKMFFGFPSLLRTDFENALSTLIQNFTVLGLMAINSISGEDVYLKGINSDITIAILHFCWWYRFLARASDVAQW